MQDIYIDDIGSGFPLVLVHGYLGSSEMWSLQKEFLSKYFRVITPALPGFGESYKAKSFKSINQIAKLILKILKEKKVSKFHLMGHSMGGMVVQEMVKISENRIKKLICFATGSVGDIPGRFETMDTTRDRLKKDGLKKTMTRVPQNWFVHGDKAKYYYFTHHSFNDGNSSVLRYLPINTTSDVNASSHAASEWTHWIAPYDGKLVKVLIKCAGASGGARLPASFQAGQAGRFACIDAPRRRRRQRVSAVFVEEIRAWQWAIRVGESEQLTFSRLMARFLHPER